MEFIILTVGLLIFDLAAIRWGAESREGFNELEWARRLPIHRA